VKRHFYRTEREEALPQLKRHFHIELNLRSMSTELNLNTISHRESEVSSTYYAR